MKPLTIAAGDTFGSLTVVRELKPRITTGRNLRRFELVCVCGNTCKVLLASLRKGSSTSCGCFRNKKTGDMSRTHGQTGTRLHSIWKNMRSRCTNANTPSYEFYGGRGITICPEWDNFEVFQEWALANGYSDDLTIERSENDGNYTPSNCVWATRKEQANNRRTRRI